MLARLTTCSSRSPGWLVAIARPPQQCVTDGMAEFVVRGLQQVEISDDDGDGLQPLAFKSVEP